MNISGGDEKRQRQVLLGVSGRGGWSSYQPEGSALLTRKVFQILCLLLLFCVCVPPLSLQMVMYNFHGIWEQLFFNLYDSGQKYEQFRM